MQSIEEDCSKKNFSPSALWSVFSPLGIPRYVLGMLQAGFLRKLKIKILT
jgi:hypothetical protein